MKKYPICDALYANPSQHCATLAITENTANAEDGSQRFAQPYEDLRNGTLTFVKSGGRVFGITCWHVIDHFRQQLVISGSTHSHTMRTMVNGFYVVLDRFIRPQPQFGDPLLDIAVRELNPDFPSTIGKVPIDLDMQLEAPQVFSYGYAVGFPEAMKFKKKEDLGGARISMPQLEILAEIDGLPTRRFTLYSELDRPPVHADYSGMSGGPIFWSTESDYGVFGITYEGGVGSELSGGKNLYVYGELATPILIKEWLNQIPQQHDDRG